MHTCAETGVGMPEAVCGHSLGGNVALALLEGCVKSQFSGVSGAPAHTWLWDSQPGAVDRRGASGERHSVQSVLTAVSQVQTPVESKDHLVKALLDLGVNRCGRTRPTPSARVRVWGCGSLATHTGCICACVRVLVGAQANCELDDDEPGPCAAWECGDSTERIQLGLRPAHRQ